jgi:hypothetical protein
MPEHTSELPNREHVRRAFQRILNHQPDIGAAKVIASWFFKPRNIFDPHSRRKPKDELVIFLSYVLLMAMVFAVFNSR